MGSCTDCDDMQEEKRVLYEDAQAAVVLPRKPATKGHLLVIPKEHHPIMEEVDESVVTHCFFIANRTAKVLFETLGATGTNMLIQNGLSAGQESPHFGIHIIPRQQDDGLSFRWQPKKISDQKMIEVHEALKDECDYFGQAEDKKNTEIPEEKKCIEQKIEKKMEYNEENYLLKQLKRIP